MPHGSDPGVGLGLLGICMVGVFTFLGLYLGLQTSVDDYKPGMVGWYIVKVLER